MLKIRKEAEMDARAALEAKPMSEWTLEDWDLYGQAEDDEGPAEPIEEAHGTVVTVTAPTKVAKKKKVRRGGNGKPKNGNGRGDHPTSDLLIRDEGSFVKYDRLEAKALAEGRIDGPNKCLVCGMRYLTRWEADNCCRTLP